MAPRRYRLSRAAAADLEAILEFGLERFGAETALAYYDGFAPFFAGLAEHPLRATAVEAIRPGYRRAVYRSHAVYYTVGDDGIAIMRVLGRQNPADALQEG
jgi:toxin ParE1/3/4